MSSLLVAVIMHNNAERLLYSDVLSASGLDILRAASGARNCQALLAAGPDAVLLDLDNGAAESFSLLAGMRAAHGQAVGMIGVTAWPQLASRAHRIGCDDCLLLPVANAELVARVHAYLRSGRPAVHLPLRAGA